MLSKFQRIMGTGLRKCYLEHPRSLVQERWYEVRLSQSSQDARQDSAW